ncbi:MAG: CPBP family glutamic-type intramembrane protease [Thermoplasmata archaeon]
MRCPRCGSETGEDTCPYCGYEIAAGWNDPGDDLKEVLDKIKKVFSIVAIITFLIYLFANIVLLGWSINIVFPHTFNNSTLIYAVLFLVVPLFKAGGAAFAVYYIFLVLCIILSIVGLFYYSRDSIIGFFESFNTGEKGGNSIFESPIARLAFLICALMFVHFLYTILVDIGGVTPRTPGLEEEKLWVLIYGLTRAAAWEEIVVRIPFIGIPMLLLTYVKGKTDWKKYILGGFGLRDRNVIWFILLSSVIFATAHLGSWDLYKLLPTFVAGLVFGYLYVKDGLYSCIILHFVWDYTAIYYRLPGYMLNGVIIVVFIWIVLGVYFTYHYVKSGVTWLIRKPSGVKRKSSERSEPEERTTAGIDAGFICPNCRNYKAVYTERGKLRCIRCGTDVDPKAKEAKKELGGREKMRQWPPMD